MTTIAKLKGRLGGLKVEDNPAIVKQKSRDFFWYSPVLKRQLDDVTADLVVSPKTEAEVIEVLKACFEEGVPVTPRGSGTGNYGQAMPLSGGVVLSQQGTLIATYALCGFANFSSIAIQIGGIGGLAPERRQDLARLGLRAVLGGSIATFMTATIAGVITNLS